MATWQTIDANDLPLVPQLLALLNQVEPVLQALQTAAEAAATGLGILSDLLDSIGDPTAVIRAAIDALIQDLIENRVGVLLVKPQFQTGTRDYGLDGFGRILENSLRDEGDLLRPRFEPGDMSLGAIFLVSAPSFQEIITIAEAFQKLFGEGWQELIDLARALPGVIVPVRPVYHSGVVTSIPDGADPRTTFVDDLQLRPHGGDRFNGQRITMVTGKNSGLESRVDAYDKTTGRFSLAPALPAALQEGDAYVTHYLRSSGPPDWRSVRVIDVFPPLASVTELLARVRDSIGPQTRALAIIDRIVEILERKIALLQLIAQQIQELIDLLQVLGEVTNVNVLPVPPQPLGNEGFVRAFYEAENKPPIANNAVVMGIVLYGGSGLAGTLSTILGPLF